MANTESTRCFNDLPNELIYKIFDYLPNNDIIYILFNCNRRLRGLLLSNKKYLNYLELPTTNLDLWRNILSIMGSETELLNINTIDLSLPLSYFPNLKSIIISSPYGLLDEKLKLIFECEQFKNLHSLEIKENDIFFGDLFNNYLTDQAYTLNKVFNSKNSLKTFQYSLTTPPISIIDIKSFEIHLNLHSLTIRLVDFKDIFTLIEYTPNLNILNVQSDPPYRGEKPINKIKIELTRLYLTLNYMTLRSDTGFRTEIDLDQLTDGIKQFSSSLTYLSLNLVGLSIKTIGDFPLNSTKLKLLLEPMGKLKQFHLYTKLGGTTTNVHNILSSFKDGFWFDHDWSFGMHRNYFYTLPFHFDYLYEFYGGFDDVKLNNDKILTDNYSGIWCNVKSIELARQHKYDLNFIKRLKTEMPKLTSIRFGSRYNTNTKEPKHQHVNNDEKSHVTLDNVTTIECAGEIEDENEWLTYALPNLKHLILSSSKLFLISSELVPIPIINGRIEQLNINQFSLLEELAQAHVYFGNVQYINICFQYYATSTRLHASLIMNILENFKNLKVLIIHVLQNYKNYTELIDSDLNKLIIDLDMTEIKKNYRVNSFGKYCLFSKNK